MLFDFQAFIEELKENPEKKQIVEKYEKLIWPINGTIKDQEWYTEYLSKFDPVSYKIPTELVDDFDWDLLQQLVLWSFSSDYELKNWEEESERELYIAVKSGDQSVVKTVSELWSFQILRLYEIYVEEQMNLHTLRKEEEEDKIAIDWERDARHKRWKAVLDTFDKEELSKKAKEEQESKLGDLMWKL